MNNFDDNLSDYLFIIHNQEVTNLMCIQIQLNLVNVKPHNVARALVVLIDREELSFY